MGLAPRSWTLPRPTAPHPLFAGLVAAALAEQAARDAADSATDSADVAKAPAEPAESGGPAVAESIPQGQPV